MTQLSNKFVLSAAALAVSALLAACGGGEAGPPPDVVPPTLAITDNVSEATATGPVTFTFTFSEDVGSSFTAEDIVVTGGAAGAFTKVDATHYTLAVTPTENATGTITVSVDAAKFSDRSSNANTAASTATQAYSTVVTPPPGGATLLISWDEDPPVFTGMGAYGDAAPSVEAAPAGGSGKALKILKPASAPVNWGGVYFGVPPFPFTAERKTITARVYSTRAGAVIKFKVEASDQTAVEVAANEVTGAANTWTTLTWTLAGVDPAKTYNIVAITPDPEVPVSGQAYWIEDVSLAAAASGGGGGSTSTIASFDENPPPTLASFGTNGAGAEIAADPAGGSNKVLKVFKYVASEQWAGTTISTLPGDSIPRIPFTETAKKITMRVYSPAVGVRVRMKVEDATNGGVSVETDTLTTVANAWETLTFDFANPAKNPPETGGPTAPLDVTKNYTRLSVFADFGLGAGGTGPLPADRVYYFDDIKFGGAASGGGGATGSGVFGSGYTQGGATAQGGSWGYFSGDFSSYDNTYTGGGFADTGVGDDAAQYFYIAVTTTAPTKPAGNPPTSGGYLGMYVTYPGNGLSIAGRSSLAINLGVDANLFKQTANKDITLFIVGAKEYDNGSGGKCKVSLTRTVTPTTDAMITYTLPLSSFTLAQGCNGGGFNSGITTAAQALAEPVGAVNSQLSYPNVNTTINSGSASAPIYATGITRGKTEFK